MDEEQKKSDTTTTEPVNNADWQSLAEERLNGWKRALADYENLKRDTERRQEQNMIMARLGFALDFLAFYDNFLLALEHIPAESRTESWAVGFDHIRRQADDLIRNLGLTAMQTKVGDHFDHQRHEAVETTKDGTMADQQITKVISDGYMLDTSVIRPAKVIVNNAN